MLISPLRQTLGTHLGQVLTPELAALIEQAGIERTDAKKHNDYELETAEYLRHGLRLFQAIMVAETEAEHAEILHRKIGAPVGSLYIDMGCGVGEMSRLFGAIDPAGHFISVTNSEVQAALTRDMGGSEVILTDFHNTGIPGGVADVVMFNETWGYGDPQRLAAEAYRLLKPGGRLFIKDWYSKTSGYSPEWDWWQWDLNGMQRPLLDAGFSALSLQKIEDPSSDRYDRFIQASELMQRIHPCRLRLSATPAYFVGVKP